MAQLTLARQLVAVHKRSLGLPAGRGLKLAGEGVVPGKIKKASAAVIKKAAAALINRPGATMAAMLKNEGATIYTVGGILYLVSGDKGGAGPGRLPAGFDVAVVGVMPGADNIVFGENQQKLTKPQRDLLQTLSSQKLMARDYNKMEKFLRLHHDVRRKAASRMKKGRGPGVGAKLPGSAVITKAMDARINARIAKLQGGEGIFDDIGKSVGKAAKSVGKAVSKGAKTASRVVKKAAKAAGKELALFAAGKTAFKPSMLLTGLSGIALLASVGFPPAAPILGPAATGLGGLSAVAKATGRGVSLAGGGVSLVGRGVSLAGGGLSFPKFTKKHGMIALGALAAVLGVVGAASGTSDSQQLADALQDALSGGGLGLHLPVPVGKKVGDKVCKRLTEKDVRQALRDQRQGRKLAEVETLRLAGQTAKKRAKATARGLAAAKRVTGRGLLSQSILKAKRSAKSSGSGFGGSGPGAFLQEFTRPGTGRKAAAMSDLVLEMPEVPTGPFRPMSGRGLTCQQKQAKGLKIACPTVQFSKLSGSGQFADAKDALGARFLGGGPPSKATGSRAEVWHGSAMHTAGGLTRADLMMNSRGAIVSRKASARAHAGFAKSGLKPGTKERMTQLRAMRK